MSDQADRLRQLAVASRGARKREGPRAEDDGEPHEAAPGRAAWDDRCCSPAARGASAPRTWSLNLAIALGELGYRVLLIDADIGLANLDLLCDLSPRYDLGDVLAGRLPPGGGDHARPARHPDHPGGARDPDGCGSPGGRPGAAAGGVARAGIGVGLRAGGRRLGPRPGRRRAGLGGRCGGDRHDARADIDGRRARRDRPVPAAGVPASAPGRGESGDGRRPRRRWSSTGWRSPAVSSSGRWSRRWARGRSGPTPMWAVRSEGVGRSSRPIRPRSHRSASGGWPAPWSASTFGRRGGAGTRTLRGPGCALGPESAGRRLSRPTETGRRRAVFSGCCNGITQAE